MAKCKWCGEEFEKKHNRQIYCSATCSEYALRVQKTILARKYREANVQKGVCKWCGKEFEKHHGQLYCSDACRKYSRMEQKAIFSRKYRKTYVQKESLGTGGLGSHSKHDFSIEYLSIQKEKKRLQI